MDDGEGTLGLGLLGLGSGSLARGGHCVMIEPGLGFLEIEKWIRLDVVEVGANGGRRES